VSTGAAGAFARLIERRVGSLSGESARAASVTQAFLVFAFTLAIVYAVFFVVYEVSAIVVSSVVTAAVFIAGLVLVNRGHQLAASIIALTAGTAQVTVVTAYLGWIAGWHLYLIAVGQLVYMIFTSRQRVLRWVYVAIAIGAFCYCQLVVSETGTGVDIPPVRSGVLFSANATITLLMMYTLSAVAYYSAARLRAQADAATARAEYLANTDELTGLPNRRPILKRLSQLSTTTSYAVAIADLDHFKRLNDTFGHECGDTVLAVVGARLRESLRSGDSVGRWGGEEFIFVMADSTLEDAATTMERVRTDLAQTITCMGHSHNVTVSVGVTNAHPDGMTHGALQRADLALYEAKRSGRNAVRSLAGPPPITLPQPDQRRRRS